MKWLELSVQVDNEAVESVTEVFSRFVKGGVAIEEDITAFGDRDGYVVNTDKPVAIRAYLPVDDTCGCSVSQIKDALDHLSMIRPIGELAMRQVAEEDWANAWKEHFQVHRVGPRTVIVPSWRQYDPLPDDVVITLDPGMAFGTGLHPTTRLCLMALEERVRPGQSILDLGTGSGILAIAAARLGAGSVLALDTDAVAVQAARANMAANGVQETVRVDQGTLGTGARSSYPDRRSPDRRPTPVLPSSRPATFDLVVANIIAQVLVDLAQPLATALGPGAPLIVSGIINEREADVAAALVAQGLIVEERKAEGDWVLLVARRSQT
jgi:ribosomal protein L11 methyltransferase